MRTNHLGVTFLTALFIASACGDSSSEKPKRDGGTGDASAGGSGGGGGSSDASTGGTSGSGGTAGTGGSVDGGPTDGGTAGTGGSVDGGPTDGGGAACLNACGVGCPAPEYWICASDGNRYCNTCIIGCHGLSVADAGSCSDGG